MTRSKKESRPCIVVGEGIAGQATALALCSAGVPVHLVALAPAEQSESCLRADGIDAAVHAEDSPGRHAEELIELSAGLASEPALSAVAERAPALVERLSRLGVPFDRTRSGAFVLEQMPGSKARRTLFAGSLTGRHVSRRLSQLLLAFEARGLLERHVGFQLCELVLSDAGRVVGIVARRHATGELSAFRGDGVCLATGGYAGLFAADTLAPGSLGAATGLAFRRGARLEDPDRVTLSRLGYQAGGFVRVLPERLLALGGSVEAGLLDLTSLDRAKLRSAASRALEAHRTHTGMDALSGPVAVVDVPVRSLGGLWVDFDAGSERPEACHRTSLPGLYAVGGATSLYFGERVPAGLPLATSLLGAEQAAAAMLAEREQLESSAFDLPARTFEHAAHAESKRLADLCAEGGDDDTPFSLSAELGELLAGCVRDETPKLEQLDEFSERLSRTRAGDTNARANAGLAKLVELHQVVPLARAVITARAARREDRRGPLWLRFDAEQGAQLEERTP